MQDCLAYENVITVDSKERSCYNRFDEVALEEIMSVLRNIPFILWFYGFLFRIRGNKRAIKRYRSVGDFEKERREIRKAEDLWGRALVEKAGITLRVKGLENVPEGSVVFVSNHQSYFDIPVFFAAVPEKQIGFVAKDDLIKIPLFGSWIADVRSVFIKRDDARDSLRAISRGIELLRQGFSLSIFPEGSRSREGSMGEFKKGSLRLATKAGVPVVPVTLSGTYKIFEEKGYIRPGKVDFIIHSAIHTKDMSKKEAADLSARVEKIVRLGLDGL